MKTDRIAKVIRDHADKLRAEGKCEAVDLLDVLARILEGKSVSQSFGAPGDWGYNTPIGAELAAAYREACSNAKTDGVEALRRQEFVECLTRFLVENIGGKSVLLQIECSWMDEDPRPRLAKAWAELYQKSPLPTAPSVPAATQKLLAWLAGPKEAA